VGEAAAGGEAARVGGRARRAPAVAEEVVRRRRLLRLARVARVPHARAGLSLALPQLRDLRRLRRRAAPARGAALPPRRADASRGRGAPDRGRRAALPRVVGAGPGPGLRAAPPGDPGTAALPRRHRPRLPDARPAVAHAVGRRGPACHPRHRPRRLSHEHPLRPRRALGRPPPAGRRAARLGPAPAGRGGQRRRRRRARPRAHRRRRPRDRPGPGPGAGRGRGRLRGTGRRPPPRAALADGRLPRRPPRVPTPGGVCASAAPARTTSPT
jgi:hypothetical protein